MTELVIELQPKVGQALESVGVKMPSAKQSADHHDEHPLNSDEREEIEREAAFQNRKSKPSIRQGTTLPTAPTTMPGGGVFNSIHLEMEKRSYKLESRLEGMETTLENLQRSLDERIAD